MKQSEIISVLGKEYGSSELNELNKNLKARASEKIKFKMMGEALGHLGLTVAIKMVTAEGLKIFDVNRVRLIRFGDIETFEKAKPKVPRPVYDKPKPKPAAKAKKLRHKASAIDDEDEDEDNDFEEDFKTSRPKNRPSFIPSKSKR